MNAISRRYARALIAATREDCSPQRLESLVKDLRAFATVAQTHKDLSAVLANPAFQSARAAVVAQVNEKLSLSPLAGRLISLLCASDRIDFVDDIAEQVQIFADQQAGRARAKVRTVVPLNDRQKTRITRALEKRVGGNVDLDVTIDPTILGGLVCAVGDLTFDNSLRNQLERLTDQLVGLVP